VPSSPASIAPSAVVAAAPAQTSALSALIAPTLTPRTVVDLPLDTQAFETQQASAVHTSAEPEVVIAEPAPASPPTTAVPQRAPRNSQEAFIFQVAVGAQESQRTTGVPSSVAIAQAILESSWGRSFLAREANNLFGVKALTKEGPAGVVWIDAWEVQDGQDINVPQPFRKYHTVAESIVDHGLFFIENRRYASALAAKDDGMEFARRIAAAGYATDPDYAPKLMALMDRYDLYQWDV
jgi:flagellar protein FlgJ